jgi:hypothetical protein
MVTDDSEVSAAYSFSVQGWPKDGALLFSIASVKIYQSSSCHNPEDNVFHIYESERLKSYIIQENL